MKFVRVREVSLKDYVNEFWLEIAKKKLAAWKPVGRIEFHGNITIHNQNPKALIKSPIA